MSKSSQDQDYRLSPPSSNKIIIAGILGGAIVVIGMAVSLIIGTREREERFQIDIEQYDCKLDSHDLGNGCRPGRICYACNDSVERCK